MKYERILYFIISFSFVFAIGSYIRYFGGESLRNAVHYDTIIGKSIYLIIMSVITAIIYFGGTFACSLLLTNKVLMYIALGWVIALDILSLLYSTDMISVTIGIVQVATTITPVLLRDNSFDKQKKTPAN